MVKKVIVLGLIAGAAFLSLSQSAYAQSTRAPKAVVTLSSTEPFEFNGLDQSLNLGRSNGVNFADGDFTVHLTQKFASLTSEGGPCFSDSGCDMSLVDKMSSPTEVNSDGWRILKQSDNRFWFCLGDFDNGCDGERSTTTVISQTEAEVGSWHSITAVKASGVIKIYVDGVLEGTTVLGSFTNTDSADLRIGANDPEGAFLAGWIGHVSPFREALNDGQVKALHAQTLLAHR
jgi:hypothetical protein